MFPPSSSCAFLIVFSKIQRPTSSLLMEYPTAGFSSPPTLILSSPQLLPSVRIVGLTIVYPLIALSASDLAKSASISLSDFFFCQRHGEQPVAQWKKSQRHVAALVADANAGDGDEVWATAKQPESFENGVCCILADGCVLQRRPEWVREQHHAADAADDDVDNGSRPFRLERF